MTQSEKLADEINGFFKSIGEKELVIPKPGEWVSEVDLLRKIKAEYQVRLLQKMPQYRSLPSDAIPDMFLLAIRKREDELLSKPL
jgi:hypothetical protein